MSMNGISVLLFLSLMLSTHEPNDGSLNFHDPLFESAVKERDPIKMAAQAAFFYETNNGIPDCFSYYDFLRFLTDEIPKEHAYWLLVSDVRVQEQLEMLRIYNGTHTTIDCRT